MWDSTYKLLTAIYSMFQDKGSSENLWCSCVSIYVFIALIAQLKTFSLKAKAEKTKKPKDIVDDKIVENEEKLLDI